MSINNLFYPNGYDLKCHSIETSGNDVINGNLQVDGTTILNGLTTINDNLNINGNTLNLLSASTHANMISKSNFGQSVITAESSTGQSAFLRLSDTTKEWEMYQHGFTGELFFQQNGLAVNKNIVMNLGTGILQLASNGINFNGSSPLNDYAEQIVTLTYSGCFTTPQNNNVRITKVGKMVTLTFVDISSPSTIAGQGITSTPIPLAYVPLEIVNANIFVQDNTAITQGRARIDTAGVLNVSVGVGSNFTALGNAGFPSFSISYSLSN